jgi:hypothetical protein
MNARTQRQLISVGVARVVPRRVGLQWHWWAFGSTGSHGAVRFSFRCYFDVYIRSLEGKNRFEILGDS